MIECLCMVQAGQISADAEAALRDETNAFSERAFSAPAVMNWIVVPERSGYTAARPSTSVIVSMQSNRKLSQSERVTLLKELCDIWMKGANRSMEEVVATIRDPEG